MELCCVLGENTSRALVSVPTTLLILIVKLGRQVRDRARAQTLGYNRRLQDTRQALGYPVGFQQQLANLCVATKECNHNATKSVRTLLQRVQPHRYKEYNHTATKRTTTLLQRVQPHGYKVYNHMTDDAGSEQAGPNS